MSFVVHLGTALIEYKYIQRQVDTDLDMFSINIFFPLRVCMLCIRYMYGFLTFNVALLSARLPSGIGHIFYKPLSLSLFRSRRNTLGNDTHV